MSDDADGCGCQGDTVRAQHDPACRRALWIVLFLHSPTEIINHARRELSEPAHAS